MEQWKQTEELTPQESGLRGKLGRWLALVGVFVLLLLLMVQIDRQWQQLSLMSQTLQEQAEDIRHVRKLLRQMGQGSPTAPMSSKQTGSEQPLPADAFGRARAAAAQPDYATGDWLSQAFNSSVRTLTPLVSSDAYASEVQSFVLESLLSRDADTLEWQGLLAKNWTVSADGMRIEFTLRRDISFSDGVALTARDVAFSFAFIMNEAIAAPRLRAYYNKIERVTALDDERVEFIFAEPYFNSMSLAGGMGILPEHFYRRFVDDPRRFNESRGLLLGSGPYRLADPESWSPDQGSIVLERNPRYWGPVDGSFDRIVWRLIENDTARLTTFQNGDIDLYSAAPREYQRLLNDKTLAGRSQHFAYQSPTSPYSYIAWNQRRGDKPTPFADVRVRKALSLLTDVDHIIDTIFLGYAEAVASPFNRVSVQHNPLIEPMGHDIERARLLLREAGYELRGQDGIVRDAAGKALEFELSFPQSSEDARRMVLLLRDLYARAGVVMKPRPVEFSMMLEDLNHKNFDAITLAWTTGVESDVYQMFHSSQMIDGGDNFISYHNPELDRLLEAARSEVDEAKRIPLWHQVEAILVADQPYTFLLRRKSLIFVDQRIHNLEQTRSGLNLTAVPTEVYVPAAQQRRH